MPLKVAITPKRISAPLVSRPLDFFPNSYGCGKMRRSKKQNKEGNEDMKLSYTELVKRPTLLHRLSGLMVKEFETLLESFSPRDAQRDSITGQKERKTG